MVFRGCFKDVSRVFCGCFKGVARVLHLFQWKGVFRVFESILRIYTG